MIVLAGTTVTTVLLFAGLFCIFTSVTAVWNEQRCPNCEYDLRGRPVASLRCPECGYALQAKTNSSYVRRSRHRFLVGVGYLLAAGTVLLLSLFLWFSRRT
jgi:hypothetical protein